MRCEFCTGETHARKVRRQHWLRRKLYIVENVEAQVCLECGERYFDAKTLDSIDDLVSGDHHVKEVMPVEVLSA